MFTGREEVEILDILSESWRRVKVTVTENMEGTLFNLSIEAAQQRQKSVLIHGQ
jgi:hypothetical protein